MSIKSMFIKLVILTTCIASHSYAMDFLQQRVITPIKEKIEKQKHAALTQQVRQIRRKYDRNTLCYLASPKVTDPQLITIYGQIGGKPHRRSFEGFSPLHHFAIGTWELTDTQLEKLKRLVVFGVPLNRPVKAGTLKGLPPISLLKARMLLNINNTEEMAQCIAIQNGIQDGIRERKLSIIKLFDANPQLPAPLIRIILTYSESELRHLPQRKIIDTKDRLSKYLEEKKREKERERRRLEEDAERELDRIGRMAIGF
ncbi:MAG: hypothetical protein ACHQVS_02015 [Candidatus Babeliales bacterium]